MNFFLTESDFLIGDTNIYFKQTTFFEKKDFVKIIHIFFFIFGNYLIIFYQVNFAIFEQRYMYVFPSCLLHEKEAAF